MDRRTKQRLDLQLLGRMGQRSIRGGALQGITENISRDGILMRWCDGVPTPEVGASLTVDFTLPESEGFGQRIMRCRTLVVRIGVAEDGHTQVAMRIDGISFTEADADGRTAIDLKSVPSATERVN